MRVSIVIIDIITISFGLVIQTLKEHVMKCFTVVTKFKHLEHNNENILTVVILCCQ